MRTDDAMKKVFVLFLFCFIFLTLPGCMPGSKLTPINSFEPKQQNQLRVANYGIVTDLQDWPFNNPAATCAAIKMINPDVILLQETTLEWQQHFKKYFSKQFPYQQFRQHVNNEGLGVLSKYPIHNEIYINSPSKWYPAWLVYIDTPLGRVHFLIVHLFPTLNPSPTPDSFPHYSIFTAGSVREQEMKHFHTYLHSTNTTIISGDFNEGDYGKANQYLKSQGLNDALAFSNSYTWHWYILFFRLVNRYDHMYYYPNNHLIPARVQVLDGGGSDHYPLVVDFVKNSGQDS